MVEQDGGLDGRVLTKNVIADFCEGWRAVWLEAIRLRDNDPEIRRQADLAPSDDPAGSIQGLVPHLARLHPTVATGVIALLDLVIEESRAETAESVRGVGYNRGVSNGEGTGDQQQQDRLAELEAENAELRRLLKGVAAVCEAATTSGSGEAP